MRLSVVECERTAAEPLLAEYGFSHEGFVISNIFIIISFFCLSLYPTIHNGNKSIKSAQMCRYKSDLSQTAVRILLSLQHQCEYYCRGLNIFKKSYIIIFLFYLNLFIRVHEAHSGQNNANCFRV